MLKSFFIYKTHSVSMIIARMTRRPPRSTRVCKYVQLSIVFDIHGMNLQLTFSVCSALSFFGFVNIITFFEDDIIDVYRLIWSYYLVTSDSPPSTDLASKVSLTDVYTGGSPGMKSVDVESSSDEDLKNHGNINGVKNPMNNHSIETNNSMFE